MTEHEQSGSRPEDSDKSSDDLRAEVEQTRERLSRDVEAIGTKLSPEHIKMEAKRVIKDKVDRGEQQIRETVGTAANSVSSFVGENPIPLALIGAGLGWLLYNARSKHGQRGARLNYATHGRSEVWDDFGNGSNGDGSSAVRGVERKLHQLRDKVRDGAETVKHSASEKANLARQKVNQLEHAAHDELDKARDVAVHTLAEQPLLLGAVALGVGIAVGLGLPSTESENHLVGQYRDKLVSRAKDQLGEFRDKAENVARQTFESAKDTAKAGTDELLGTQAT